jgi:hypothetical protein
MRRCIWGCQLPAAITKGGERRDNAAFSEALLLELEHMGLPGNTNIHAHAVAKTILDMRVRVRLARRDII